MTLSATTRSSIGAAVETLQGVNVRHSLHRAYSSNRAAHSLSGSLTRPGSRPRTQLNAKASEGDVIISKSFALPLGVLGGAALAYTSDNLVLTAVLGALGAILTFGATRLRFKFSATTLEVLVDGKDDRENVFVGGKNEWKFDSFTNWEFWWPNFPILVYFKETQTKPEGQIHFFPITMNGKELYEVMVERCGPSMNSGPK